MIDVIETIEGHIAEFENPFLQEMWAQISHGKLLRSSLILAIAGKNEQSIKLSAIIELIQLASLLHDDVIDGSQMRRGREAINARFGNQNAIMLGDALYAKAFYHLASFPTPIAKSVSHAVCKLSSGEIYDVFLSSSFNPSLERYYTMIEEKTASLIASSAECSAILAGLESQDYFHYGKCLGVAFQIVDDILDITQSQEILGKPAMSDFRDGKMTLPYLLLYERLDACQQDRLQNLCGKELSAQEEQWIRQEMQEMRILEESHRIAEQFGRDSIVGLKGSFNPKLEEIIQSILKRSF